MTLGEKIKQLRLEKGITQARLCAGEVTRNMLSRIENGAALPSLPTLIHIAEALGVSAGYFLDDTDELLPYKKLTLMPLIKSCYRKGDYADALALCNSIEGDDEAALIAAECLLNMGIRLFREERLKSAEGFFRRAIDAAKSCLYDLSHIEKTAAERIAAIQRARAEKLPDFPPAESAPYAEHVEYYLYVYMLYITKNLRYDLAASIYDTMKFSSTLYRKHINARLSLAARNTSRAVTLLKELTDTFETTHCDPLIRLSVLSDMESISRTVGDYEQAYRCLQMKNDLFAAFDR